MFDASGQLAAVIVTRQALEQRLMRLMTAVIRIKRAEIPSMTDGWTARSEHDPHE
jgi:hypothetical protein